MDDRKYSNIGNKGRPNEKEKRKFKEKERKKRKKDEKYLKGKGKENIPKIKYYNKGEIKERTIY